MKHENILNPACTELALWGHRLSAKYIALMGEQRVTLTAKMRARDPLGFCNPQGGGLAMRPPCHQAPPFSWLFQLSQLHIDGSSLCHSETHPGPWRLFRESFPVRLVLLAAPC